jgi:PPOX class probable F420-dependent enzyme
MDMLEDLAHCRFISLTTFRRDGTEASTPVWVVSDDGRRLLVWTGTDTWKARRIRRDPRVFVAPSDYRGRELGPRREAKARLLGEDAGPLVTRLLRRKYGWQRRALELQGALARLTRRTPGADAAYIEIT